MTKPQRAAILSKTSGKCAYCGVPLQDRWQIDHIIHRWHVDQYRERYPADFDVNHPDNLMPSCCSCNNYKSGTPLEVFRQSIARRFLRHSWCASASLPYLHPYGIRLDVDRYGLFFVGPEQHSYRPAVAPYQSDVQAALYVCR